MLNFAEMAPKIRHTVMAARKIRQISRFLYLTIILWFTILSHPASLNAQFTAEPQALTQEEYDQYLTVAGSTDPAAVIATGESFEKAFPESAMLPKVYRMQLDAWKALGNARNAVLVGEKALQLVPENVDIMSELAYLIADTEADAAELEKAKEYGLGAIELLDKLQIPRTISPKEWNSLRGSLASRAYSALGLVAFKSGHLKESITQFELALGSGASDDSALLFRLGVSYRLAGMKERARAVLTRAEASENPEIQRRAREELLRLSQ
jgi:tetratricopeptide (TPR) repeat protein